MNGRTIRIANGPGHLIRTNEIGAIIGCLNHAARPGDFKAGYIIGVGDQLAQIYWPYISDGLMIA